MQDGSTVMTTAQLQSGVQGGKSLLKPELAQHLNQHVGYKSAVGRGGFTLGSGDSRWVNMNTPRSNRTITRKPMNSAGPHMQSQQMGQMVQQPTTMGSTASGLLSLGSRYTPSSTTFGSMTSAAGGTPTGTGATGLMQTSGLDRDPNYRLAAAMAGTGGRGRPRGRRPLRGQFPVVPIDMVRQLGIEQQVILQPAAPVAMRNKAVLCRPLSMCRKTQASMVQCEPTQTDSGTPMQTDEFEDSSLRRLVRKKEMKTSRSAMAVQTEDSEDEQIVTSKARYSDVQTSTPATALVETASQTDIEEKTTAIEEEKKVTPVEEAIPQKPLILPIPIPVPIYVPIPVYLYARPVPYLLPFPLPCFLPLPVMRNPEAALTDELVAEEEEEIEMATMDDLLDEHVPMEATEILSDSSESSDVLQLPLTVGEESVSPKTLVESVALESEEHELVLHDHRGLKRSAPSPDSETDDNNIHSKREDTGAPDAKQHVNELTVSHHVDTIVLNDDQSSKPTTPPLEASRAPLPPQVPQSTVAAPPPPSKRPRHTIVVSDANYHLKFSYGINAWRHWVQQKLASLGGTAVAQQQCPYLKTELLSMSESDLNMALSQFVREVRKPNNECYVADSIFYLCLGIQEYLNENGCTINLFGGPIFADFSSSLDNILANFQPRISPEGLLICRIEEEHLWEAQQLGAETPEILLFTMLYLNTKHFGLRLGTAHRQLAFAQIQFTDSTVLCHLPSSVFDTSTADDNESVSTTLRLDTNEDYPERCPVQLFKAYFARCPPHIRSADGMFYMLPDHSVVGEESEYWYSTTPMESTELQVILNRIKMVKEIQEAFMNGQPDCGF